MGGDSLGPFEKPDKLEGCCAGVVRSSSDDALQEALSGVQIQRARCTRAGIRVVVMDEYFACDT